MAIETVLFDMDGVLSHYDFAHRLEVLSAGTGVPAAEIDQLIFGSGFDAAADDGAYDADEYMAEFSRRLGVPVSTELWLEAREASMTIDLEMLAIVRAVAERARVAMLTNNGPVLRAHLARVAPEIAALFGERAFFSCQFGTGKTSPEVFRLVLDTIGGLAETALFIDDTEAYAENARVAGLRTHHFSHDSGGVPALRAELERLELV